MICGFSGYAGSVLALPHPESMKQRDSFRNRVFHV